MKIVIVPMTLDRVISKRIKEEEKRLGSLIHSLTIDNGNDGEIRIRFVDNLECDWKLCKPIGDYFEIQSRINPNLFKTLGKEERFVCFIQRIWIAFQIIKENFSVPGLQEWTDEFYQLCKQFSIPRDQNYDKSRILKEWENKKNENKEFSVVVNYHLTKGRLESLEERYVLEEITGRLLESESIGCCDGGDIGEEDMNIMYITTDPFKAMDVIKQSLKEFDLKEFRINFFEE